jgi:steroid delta-isomerase-like uncharacterized protein
MMIFGIKEGEMKNPLLVVSLVLLLCFAFGCQNKAEKAELEKFRAQAKVEEQNKALFHKFIEEWSNKNVDFVKDVYAPDFISSDNESKDEAIENDKTAWEAFPDLNVTIKESVAVGDIVFSTLIFTGTHKGMFSGIPATGNRFEVSGMNLCRFKNGKIIEEREEMDMLGLFMQLGMELKPKEAKK